MLTFPLSPLFFHTCSPWWQQRLTTRYNIFCIMGAVSFNKTGRKLRDLCLFVLCAFSFLFLIIINFYRRMENRPFFNKFITKFSQVIVVCQRSNKKKGKCEMMRLLLNFCMKKHTHARFLSQRERGRRVVREEDINNKKSFVVKTTSTTDSFKIPTTTFYREKVVCV